MSFWRLLVGMVLCAMFAFGSTDTIIVGVENETERINPLFDEDHDALLDFVYSGLTRFDENMQLAPDLARSWEISQDGLEYTFFLRDDVLWHDGVKFSAKDVQFTIQAALDSKLNAPAKENFSEVKKIEIINDTTIKISLHSPYQALLDVLSIGILPEHKLKGKDINTDSFNRHPIGTGPFVFEEWKRGQYVKLRANQTYHLQKVKTKHMIVKFIQNPNIRALELENGQIDVALVEQSMAKKFQNNKNFHVLVEDSADYRALMFNLNHPILQDRQVRVALNYATNKEALIATLIHNLGSVAHHPLQKSWANPSQYPQYHYNPQKAQNILKEAGWKKNKEGFLQKDGKLLEFDMYAMSNDPLRVSLVNVLHNDFLQLGIKTNIIAKPSGSFDYTQVDTFLVGWGSPYDPDINTYRIFSSTAKNNWNFGHYANDKVNHSLELARTQQSQEKRSQYYKEFIDEMFVDPPFIFLTYLQFPLVYHNKIQGIKPHILGHHGAGFTWNVAEWSKQ